VTTYTIKISNCNNIEEANIQIETNRLNIKYGPNGLGKSTISKAIVGQIRNDGTLADLLPFKLRKITGHEGPSVTGVEGLQSALIFDEAYVNQFSFQQDEVVKNSFEIFIKTPEYDAMMAEIASSFEGIKKAFQDSDEIEQTTKDLKDLRDAFGKANQDGSISKASKVLKAFGAGNKIDNIPEQLLPFESFIKGDAPSKWVGWQIKGNEFLKDGDTCPYCATKLPEQAQKDTVLAVSKEYNATAVDHLNTLKAVIERLGKYFSSSCQVNLEKIVNAKFDLTAPEKSFLGSLKTAITALIEQLEGLRTISFFALRDVDEIDAKLQGLKIDLGMIDKLDSTETKKVIDPINAQLEELLKKVGILKGQVGKQKAKIKKAIDENQSSINGFLKSAGYRYTVSITPEPDSYKMKLEHNDLNEHIETASKHLSYGERNAFALVLFMHEVSSKKPSLVILDDPISSFDKNKKFAILHELFRGKGSLRDCTTLMLTHDIEPAIDVVKSTASLFAGSKPQAAFLSSKKNTVSEVTITKADIRTFGQICNEIIGGQADNIIKAIYLRRHFEITDNVELEYNLLASLLHKREVPTIKSETEDREMSDTEKTTAEAAIKGRIQNFDYDELLKQLNDFGVMKTKYESTNVGYEKIQLFRLIKGKHEDDIISKFINESYHIENEYVMQLDPRESDSIPEYVVNECDRLLVES
jgi:energy-coupling factor transporter ATP-binding protein EcfA2